MPMSRGPMAWLDTSGIAIGMLPPVCSVPRLLESECTSTAFVTLITQTHASFDFTELTRNDCTSARQRTGLLGVRVPCSDRIPNRDSPLHDLTCLHL